MIRAAFVLLTAAQLFGGGERNTREGAEHFEAGRLEEALRAFSRAEGEFPDAPENDLNIAGVHYRLGEAEGAPAGEEGPLAEALRGYRAALQGGAGGPDGEVRRDAFYNLANTLFRAGAFREAAAAYGEAIALDPEDLEARQNLERALRAADDEEQQGGSPDQQQQDQQHEQDQEPQDQEPQGQQSPEEQGQDRQDSPASGDRDQESGQEPQQPPPDGPPEPQDRPPAGDASGSEPQDAGPGAETPDSVPGEVPEISPEQAERILAALADVERAFQEDRLEKRRARALRRGRH